LETGGRRFRFDPRRAVAGDVNLVSHAHSDHIPSSFRASGIVCSPITRDMIGVRRGKTPDAAEDSDVESLEAGHIPGSNMFLVSGDDHVLYTGDFCTREKPHLQPAKPTKCHSLVMEATYGRPRYVFPDHEDVLGEARDWLEDLVSRGRSAVLFAYPLGKSQELSAAFRDLPLRLHPSIAENNKVLGRHGRRLCTEEIEDRAGGEPVVYITSGMGKDRERVARMRKEGAKTAAFSGWALDRGFSRSPSVDEAFPLSDHCGYDELMVFVKKCSPEVVYTTHGFDKAFASSVRKELGIDARPLIARQRTMDQFC
jgi:putative mRNA 3-end processing factor